MFVLCSVPNILFHYLHCASHVAIFQRHRLAVNRNRIRIFKHFVQIRFGSFLQGIQRTACKAVAHPINEVGVYCSDNGPKRQFWNDQLGGPLQPSHLPKGSHSRPRPTLFFARLRLLDTATYRWFFVENLFWRRVFGACHSGGCVGGERRRVMMPPKYILMLFCA
jgi:hypothetical protein